MAEWEPPRRASRRTAATALVIAGLTLVVGVVAAVSQPGTGPPPGELAVEPRPTAPPSIEATAWRPLRPGAWRILPAAPLTPRVAHDIEWTGSRVLVWGGFDVAGRPLADGGLFDPVDGTWQPLPAVEQRGSAAYAARFGDDLIVVSATGAQRYVPSEDRWRVEAPLPPLDGYALTDQVVPAGDGVVAVLRPTTDGGRRPAVFALRPDDAEWRRLPDPPVQFTNGDVLLGDQAHALLFARPLADRPAGGVRIDLTGDDARWQPVAAPPGIDEHALVRLLGAQVGTRTVLVGIGGPGDGGYAALRDGAQWRRLDPPPAPLSPLADALWVGDGLVLWNRLAATGAVLDPRAARWTRLPPAPIFDGSPRPAAWTGSSIVAWGGFVAEGAAYRLR